VVPFQFYKRIRLGRGLRLNLSKTGVGLTFGGRGAHYTIHSSGRTTRSVGIPGTGIYWRDNKKIGGRMKRREPKGPPPTVPAALVEPAASAAGGSVGADYLEGLRLAALGEDAEAERLLERVLRSHAPLPDEAMKRDGTAGGTAEIAITPRILARVPHSHVAAALMLVEILQRSGRSEHAIQLLESLGALAPNAFLALSLADLYVEAGRWEDVLRVSEDFQRNTDDTTAQLLVYRARALRETGRPDVALMTLRTVLRSKKRDPDVLQEALDERERLAVPQER
jgi:predicted Zn-dependent protease